LISDRLANDITYLPIDDGPVLQCGIIWRSDTDRALVRAFADIAGTQGPVDLAYLITENETTPS
jgi:hypothetical protein